MDLRGRVALVTGGGGHVGKILCEALAELGAAVVVLDRTDDLCTPVVEHLREECAVQAMALPVDLMDEAAVRGVCAQVLKRFSRLDVLVNCAAFIGVSGLEGWATDFARQSSVTWRQAVELNLTAPFCLTQSCAEALTQSGHGSVVNVASIYGLVGPDLRMYDGTGLGNPAAYAASKGGLIQLTRWLATSLAPRVRVNTLTPGGIARGQSEPFHERYLFRTPLQRMGTEEDFKGAIAYLASDLSAYVTGQNLIVDGGWTAW
jgi:NAD(P)-dependent dehydrogenase (short-subunit alcohol dehydrogenase family)